MTEPQRTVHRFIHEFQTLGNEAVADELVAGDFVSHTPFPGFGRTREDLKLLFVVLRKGFPDLRADIDSQVAAGDQVATHKTLHGTHMGTFMGIAATGREVTIRVLEVLRVRDGQIVEHWNSLDVLDLMAQLLV